MEIERLGLAEWSRALPASGFDVFHTRGALEVLDEYADADLELYAGRKGEEVVGLLPVFVRKSPVGKVAFSPPPSLGVPHLGPIVMSASPKRRKRERVNRRFVRGVSDAIDGTSPFTLFRMVCQPAFTDPRPYIWSDETVRANFTYVVEVGDRSPDDLLEGFTRDLRSEIRNSRDLDVEISVEGPSSAVRVARDVVDRYEEQDATAPITAEYVEDVVSALGRRARTYVARDADGEYLSGIVVLYSNEKTYFWQGGVRRDHDGISVNSALHWRVITDICEDPPIESVDRYDLVGANTERLSAYKAKFDPELVPYYVVESTGAGMRIAKRAYQVVNR